MRAKQSRASRDQSFNGHYSIPTFHSTVAGFGANVFEDKLVAALHAAYPNDSSAPVFIQSFEVSNLQSLRTKTKMRLVQLIDADDVNPDGTMPMALARGNLT